MTASAENMFLSEKSLHFDLNCKNKEFPTHPPHSHRRSNHNTHSFLCVCSRSIISHIAEKKQSCDVASGKKIILFPPAVIQLDPPATDHTEHLARAANAVKPSGSQGAENTYSLLQRSRWVADTVQRGYSVRCQLQLIMSPFMHLGERQRWIHCVAGSSHSLRKNMNIFGSSSVACRVIPLTLCIQAARWGSEGQQHWRSCQQSRISLEILEKCLLEWMLRLLWRAAGSHRSSSTFLGNTLTCLFVILIRHNW